MANEKRPGSPSFDSYRPSDERSGPPSQGQPPRMQPPHPQSGSGQAQPPLRHPSQQPPMRGAPPPSGGSGGRGPGHGPKPRRLGFLKGALLGLLALVLIAGAGATYFILNAPADLVRDRIVAEIKAKTGRDLKISGPATFTIYPNIGVSMRDVSLSPPAGMSGKPLVTMDGLDVSVRILPLLKREVYVERIILQKPVFELYADKAGRKSWEFAATTAPQPLRYAQAQIPATVPTATDASDAPAPSEGKKFVRLEQLHFGNVRIEDGTVRYADAASGAVQEATAINMKVALSDLRQPLSAAGELAWKGQKVDLGLTLTTLNDILESKPARVALKLSSGPATANFNGSLTLKDSYDVEGALDAKSPSVRAFAKWLGATLPRVKGYGPFEAAGQLRAMPNSISLSGANIKLDGATATGQVTVETQGERPYINTKLTVSELDLNKYMDASEGGEPKPQVRPAASPAAAVEQPAAAAKSIDDLLKDAQPAAPGPRVQGYSKREGWSTEPIDLSGLSVVDADAKLSVGRLLVRDIKVGQSQLTVALKNKVLKTNFDDVQLYGGRGRGFITLDGTTPKMMNAGANLAFEGIDAQPFLQDTADFDKLSGKANLTLAVAGQGHHQQQLMNKLNGKSDFTFANGAVNGLNVAGMVRGVTQGKLSGLKTSPTEKTDFSELASTWTIVNGVASNQDLRLVSPLLRLTGAGNVMLGPQQIDYTMRPKLVSSIAGQGGAGNEQGIEVPVRIHGPWSKPDYSPDLKGVFADPNKAVNTLKEIGKQFKGQNAGEALKSILGGGKAQVPASAGETAGTAPASAQKPNAKQLLDQFLQPQ